ncbi:MAG: PhoH family protein [Rhodospirillales bacterium]|nr:PhoH family protein [Rhodospirillales bacterium]
MNPKSSGAAAKAAKQKTEHLEFLDNGLLIELFGSHSSHLARIEQQLDVTIHARGNELSVVGPQDSVEAACAALNSLYRRLERRLDVGRDDVDAAIRLARGNGGKIRSEDEIVIRTRKRHISPRSPTQADYIRAIDEFELVFGLGPAGTGKTYLAVAKAVERLVSGEVDRIILSRPALEAGEQLGFLPGDLKEKVDPYRRPLYDALHDMLPGNQVEKRLETGEIEVAPLAFMRGRTLANSFVILDEAQNTTAVQMKMILTRLGENSRMVVTGDLTQVDLPRGTRSGLRDAVEILDGIEGVAFVRFDETDVVRHPLVTRMVKAYERVEAKRRSAARYEKGDD